MKDEDQIKSWYKLKVQHTRIPVVGEVHVQQTPDGTRCPQPVLPARMALDPAADPRRKLRRHRMTVPRLVKDVGDYGIAPHVVTDRSRLQPLLANEQINVIRWYYEVLIAVAWPFKDIVSVVQPVFTNTYITKFKKSLINNQITELNLHLD